MTIKIGTRFQYSYADANPEWQVVRSRGRGTWECVIVDCPDYAGHMQLFDTQQIQGLLQWDNFIQKGQDESAAFFAGLKPGSVVHYHNGFKQFVRCVVTNDKQLLPIALVGEWSAYDLPRRRRDGTIELGYHARNMRDKKPFLPHASNVYEFNVGRHPDSQPMNFSKWGDPTKMEPISLTVPDMTPEQNKTAQLWQLVDAAKNMLASDEQDPAKLLSRLKHLVS